MKIPTSQKGSSINLDFFVSSRKHRAQNRSVCEIHEESWPQRSCFGSRPGWRTSTELTPQSHKKTINRGAQKGFTLLEIIVVVTIIAILAAYIAPKVAGRADDARIAKAKSDIRVLESSMELYKLDNFSYPSTDQGLDALVNKPAGEELKHWRKGGYIKKLNKDPWGNEYLYQIPGANGEFDIYSLGADSTVGGADEAADIGNWNLDS